MNKLCSIILLTMLSLPISVWAVDDFVVDDEAGNTEIVNQLDEEMPNLNDNVNEIDYKQPVGVKKIAKKFFAAMGGVAASTFLIYFGLTAYNRFREDLLKHNNSQTVDMSLEAPNNIEGAVKTFLDKTNWS